MRAGSDSCHCDQCGVVCKGRFEACPAVWAQGPQPVVLEQVPPVLRPAALVRREANGHGHDEPNRTAGPPDEGAATNGLPPAIVPTTGGSPEGADGGGVAVQWIQHAFDALRLEVEGLRGALAQEQALVATLVDKGTHDSGLDAESLRTLVEAAVGEAMRRDTADRNTEIAAAVASLRQDLEAVTRAQADHVAALQSSIAAAGTDNAGLQASLAAVVAGSAELTTELNHREAATRKAVRATLREELHPLVEVVAESVAQSEYELRAIGRKLEQLSESGALLSSTLADVAASVAALADGRETDGGDEAGPDAIVLPGRVRLGDWVTTASRSGPLGTRVSLRGQQSDT